MNNLIILIFTKIASTEIFFVVLASIFWFIFRRYGARSALSFLGASIGLLASIFILKEFIQSPRPSNALIEVGGYAFPSAHASAIAFLAVIFSYLNRKDRVYLKSIIYILSFLVVILIGISRVYLNVHTILQVIAGFMLGIFWASVWVLWKKRF